MKIAIIGTRGIPNNYGGFEQFAEYLSKGLVTLGNEVVVYTSHDHPYQEKKWEGVELRHIYNPEKKTGTWGQFIYDLLCILDCRRRNFDIILQLGYTSSSVWGRLLPGKSLVVTNMDGLEWKRTKYKAKVRKFLLYAEKLAVKTSDYLVADSKGIQVYLQSKYKKDSVYIPYGTHIFNQPDQDKISAYLVKPYAYNMLIARMEPENNIETILDGMSESQTHFPFLIIGNYQNNFGKYLKNKYRNDERIRFLGPNYDMVALNNLRWYSNLYFHGHSVGGTNPSLLEAMASQSLVCAHKNEFNHAVLEDQAFYFSGKTDVKNILDRQLDKLQYEHYLTANLEKIESLYLWPKIIKDYEGYFKGLLRNKT